MKIYALGLFFDEEFDKYVRELWKISDEIGLLTSFMDIPGIEPHIALAIYRDVSFEDIKKRFEEYKKFKEKQSSLYFDSAAIFKATNVVFLQPNTNENLINYMLNAHHFFGDYEEKCSPFYREERWFPHCSIGKGETIDDGKKLLNYVVDKFEPQIARVTKVGLAEITYKDNKLIECRTIDYKVLS